MWHCFGGCNEGGDIFKFVMKIEGIEFIDALKLLAKKAGVQLKTSSKKYEEIKTQREKLLDICKKATIFFSTQLNKSKTGLEAKDYLMKRGLKEETIKEWKIGYAPSTWDSLCNYLIGLGYERKDIIDAGLASEKFFDRFRSRIIFPICDFNGQPVGFTGRVFNSDDEAKYLNTPNTLLYDKSQALYGLDKAKVEIRKNDSCVLVEGNVDCIMSHQSGVKNCLAVSGTALTPAHLGIIKRFSNNLILSFDMDLAGNNATKKGIDMALKNGFNVKVISMNSEKDPADIILSSGEDEWKKIIKEAKPINQFYFDLSFKDRDVKSVEDQKKIVSELLPIFKKIDNTIEQTYWIQKLAEKLSIREDDIRQEMKKVNLPKQEVEVQKEKTGKSRKELLEETILSMALIEPSIVETLTEEQKKLFTFLEKENNDSYIIMKSELLKEEDIDINEEWRKCVYEIEKIYKEEKRKKIMADIKEKEKEGSFEEVKKLLLEFNKLTKKDDKK